MIVTLENMSCLVYDKFRYQKVQIYLINLRKIFDWLF